MFKSRLHWAVRAGIAILGGVAISYLAVLGIVSIGRLPRPVEGVVRALGPWIQQQAKRGSAIFRKRRSRPLAWFPPSLGSVDHTVGVFTSDRGMQARDAPAARLDFAGAARINRELIGKAEAVDSPQRIVPDMDRTDIPVRTFEAAR